MYGTDVFRHTHIQGSESLDTLFVPTEFNNRQDNI